MAVRTFEDSHGLTWEVFEVHRATQNPGAVSAGMERGWLAFVAGRRKRRLAPFPADWELASTPELERLCERARAAAPMPDVRRPEDRPRIRRRPESSAPAVEVTAPEPRPLAGRSASQGPVEDKVRAFAREARLSRWPAIEAMVRLKAQLGTEFPEPDSDARDLRLVRRWFVESYYFDKTPPTGAPRVQRDQSR
jgi:hypothetical protein